MKKEIVTFDRLTAMVASLCRDIANSDWRPDYVVGLTRGGLLPAVMVSHYFDVPCETLKISLRDGNESESNLWMAEHAFGYVPEQERGESGTQTDPAYRRNILVVDDINDTGATITWLQKDWASGCLPNNPAWGAIWNRNVRFAVLFDNQASEYKQIDYAAHTINKLEDPVWIEFPWESWWTR